MRKILLSLILLCGFNQVGVGSLDLFKAAAGGNLNKVKYKWLDIIE